MSKIDTSKEKIEDFLERGVSEIITRDSVAKKLSSGKILRIKHGVDPSGAELHLGHTAAYLKMRDLQEMGHKIVFLVGGFTGRFGDPTQKPQTRTLKSKQETESTAQAYLDQVGQILDVKKLEIRNNSEWFDAMNAENLLKLMSNFTVDQTLERDMFQERMKKSQPIQLHELVYPVLQGYDSVMLKSDLTVIGNDQIFNEKFGRDLQRKSSQEPQDIVAIKILAGLDGQQKMSKSLNNYIALNDSAADKFGKIMSVPDSLIIDYFTLLTRRPIAEIKEMSAALAENSVNPRDLKIKLAGEIVSFFHSAAEAKTAANNFEKTFSKKETPENIETQENKKGEYTCLDFVGLSGLTNSKTEARRLIEDGAVDVDGETVDSPHKKINFTKPVTLRVGKHRFKRMVPRD
ncbi:MAG: tyrosine--tRNA ligase [Candidatus Sungbacteria bacterium]|uniref:Tyrosine--tRNA ligase n=1 Tax=Candidatus Sungiibacteriota bacterium TaxID=2750080 RepID=A0A932DSF7_9BACT|nr:tyrosine--tRNA ligase [Candidatus Sungbacteria bacterium]